MSASVVQLESRTRTRVGTTAWAFAATAALVAGGACLLAGWTPVAFSIATVFLFAGPHNWLEARYLMTRMPARWGRLRSYFLLAMIGVPLLTAAMAGLPWLAQRFALDRGGWAILLAVWNTALVLWVAALAEMRRREKTSRDWPWLWPAAFSLVALAWLWPWGWSLGLVYLHPLLALLFLDREIGRRNASLRPVYRGCLLLVPLLLGVLWWRLAGVANLPGEDFLTAQIANHAGGSILGGVNTHLLVSTHTFLEMLHYGVWCLAIPLVTFGSWPWQMEKVPLARRSTAWRRALLAVLLLGAVVMLLLWGGFLTDYSTTRNIYFTVAMLHVLAEFPFLLRLL
ncbi:MAG: hypothetical protein RIC55_30285 [Pirellulaceae bacterium]